jgi:hypothetical protein
MPLINDSNAIRIDYCGIVYNKKYRLKLIDSSESTEFIAKKPIK